jgi:hypothetical protein
MLIGNKQKFGIEVCYSYKNSYNSQEDMLSQADISIYVNNECLTSHSNNNFVNVSCYALANWININYSDILSTCDYLPITEYYDNSFDLVKILHRNEEESVNEISSWIRSRDISYSYDTCILPSITFVCQRIGSVDIVWMPNIHSKDSYDYISNGSFTLSATEVKNVFRYFIIAVAIKLRDTECTQKSKILLSRWNK